MGEAAGAVSNCSGGADAAAGGVVAGVASDGCWGEDEGSVAGVALAAAEAGAGGGAAGSAVGPGSRSACKPTTVGMPFAA